MNVRHAALLLLLAALLVGAFLAVGGHGSAEAAKTPATCSFLLNDSFADDSVPWVLEDEWEIGPASESSGHEFGFPDPAIDHTSGSDNGVAGVVIGGNATTKPHPYWYITSPTINASANMDLVGLHFWRWLNSDFAPNMVNTVEVYDGASGSRSGRAAASPRISGLSRATTSRRTGAPKIYASASATASDRLGRASSRAGISTTSR